MKDDKLCTVNPIGAGGLDDIAPQKAGDFLIYYQMAGAPGERRPTA